MPAIAPSLQPPGLSPPSFPPPSPFSGLQYSCSRHCPSLPSLLHSLSFGPFQIGIHSLPSPQGFHMVLNQFVVSTSGGGSSLRCVMVLLHSQHTSSNAATASTQPWITPSLFENTSNVNIVDEWTFGLYQNPGVALATLTQHWNTWITESDFAAIAAAGYVVLVHCDVSDKP